MAYHIDSYDNSLVIDGFDQGIADSPYLGLADIRNLNINSIPGETFVNYAMTNVTPSATTAGNVTSADATANTVTVTVTTGALVNGQVLVFSGAGLAGSGITAGTKYMIGNLSGSTFQIFVSFATYTSNTPVDITATATGTYTQVIMGRPTQRFYNKVTDTYYIIDANGRVWQVYTDATAPIYLLGNDTTTTTNASGNGIAAYRGYLFAFRNALIDYMVISTGAWTYGWQTMNTGGSTANSHYAHLGQDDVIYYCDGAFVGSFFQKAGATFDPSNSATYTWAQQALALPSNDIAQCLAELGINLLVGGQLNAIYPWNRVATSFTYPILLAENFIQRMVTVNTNTYILAGQRGKIYITNGSQASLFKKVPDHISNTPDPFYQWGDLASVRNQLYFGILAKSILTQVEIPEYGGLWSIDLDTKAIRLSNQLSYGTYAGIACVILPILPTPTGNPPYPGIARGLSLLTGWDSSASTYGIDRSSSSPYTGSQARFDSDLIPIGTYDKPRDFTRIEYKLTQALVSGESITIKYRLLFDVSDQTTPAINTYTTVLTDSTAGNYSLSGPINFKNAQWVQFQVVTNSTGSSPSFVRLKEIRVTGLVAAQ